MAKTDNSVDREEIKSNSYVKTLFKIHMNRPQIPPKINIDGNV